MEFQVQFAYSPPLRKISFKLSLITRAEIPNHLIAEVEKLAECPALCYFDTPMQNGNKNKNDNTRSISAKHVCQTCIGWGDSEERLI